MKGRPFVTFGREHRLAERPWFDFFVTDVECHQPFAPMRPPPEVRIKRDAREFTLQIRRVLFAIDRIVQYAVDVVKDRMLRDLRARSIAGAVMRLKLLQRPIGDVVYAAPVLESSL